MSGLETEVTELGPEGSATFSVCRRYRYHLTRVWDHVSPARIAAFIMLNPSTADAFILDPTIRRCVGFAKRERCTGLVVVNLFAWRATDPDELEETVDPIGPNNRAHIRTAIRTADLVIAAWGGSIPRIHRWLPAAVIADAVAAGKQLMAIKISAKTGNPCHPLYLKADLPLVPYGDAR